MHNLRSGFLLSVALTMPFTLACNQNGIKKQGDEICTTKCLQSESAVICQTQFQDVVICGPSALLAATNCEDAGGFNWTSIAVCAEDGESGDEAGTTGYPGQPWSPGDVVVVDPASGDRVIDREFVDRLQADPSPLFVDDTVLAQDQSGHYIVMAPGALADALGWETGDVLLSVDGHDVAGLAEVVEIYGLLAGSEELELVVLRGESRVILSYRIE